MSTSCTECGYPLNGNESSCPECGCPVTNPTPAPKTDWAQYFYECGVIGWESFKKYACFTGRASRRELFSFILISSIAEFMTVGWAIIIFLLPCIGVWIRRMHDIGKSGWWSLCPIAAQFLALKKSDEGNNKYGAPNPAKNLL